MTTILSHNIPAPLFSLSTFLARGLEVVFGDESSPGLVVDVDGVPWYWDEDLVPGAKTFYAGGEIGVGEELVDEAEGFW